MRAKTLRIFVVLLLMGCMAGLTCPSIWAQEVETPAETPVETPTEIPVVETPTATPVVESPTEVPVESPTDTPVPVESPTDTPVPVPPTDTPTPIPPTATPVEETQPETPTAVPEEIELILGSASGNVGETIAVSVEIKNPVDVDAFGFDVVQSTNILDFVSVETAGTLTDNFLVLDARGLADPAGAVRIGAVGGPGIVSEDGVLLTLNYTASAAGDVELSFANVLDDLAGALVTVSVVTVLEETPADTPTPVETEVDTPTPEVPTDTPTPVETEVDTPTPEVPTDTPTPVETEADTPTPEIPTDTPTPTATFTPSPTPTATAIEINPVLGLVALDELGGTYPRGGAIDNFDIGTSNDVGQLIPGSDLDGLIDPDALGPFLFIDGVPYPIARDVEFSGEVADGGNGSEGAYFLIGGSIGTAPPVSGRLGATGGENRGGIDINNDGNTINFGKFKSDIIAVMALPTDDGVGIKYFAQLVDLEPAGNDGFYVISENGQINAEGSASQSLETTVDLGGAKAVSLKVFRGKTIAVTNSQFSSDLVGTGAYVLDSNGMVHKVGTAPDLDTTNASIVPELTIGSLRSGGSLYKDLELVPNADGTEFIGVGVLAGDGMVQYIPFADVTVTAAILEHVKSIAPFGHLESGFPIDIARDLEVEVSDNPIYGLDESGNTVTISNRRVGTFMLDGFGGIHNGGAATRYGAAFLPESGAVTNYIVDGKPAVAVPVVGPYTGNIDTQIDIELAVPVNR